ncbi:MAG: hypothetical protein ACI4W6_10140 [Acutalibacteraceae bacterium]
MSEEILFADMLNHYSLKTGEISDLLSNMVRYLNKCTVICKESWQSDASEKFMLKISDLLQYVNQANSSLDDLLNLFNAMKSNELDTQIDDLSSALHAENNS